MTRGGSIILVSSAMHVMGIPGHTAYAATKAALRSYARTWATEFKGRGIRVNTLNPGVRPEFLHDGCGSGGRRWRRPSLRPEGRTEEREGENRHGQTGRANSRRDRRAAEGGGQSLDPISADITRSGDLAALRDHVATSYGRADVLFANAGIATFAPFAEVTEDAFDQTVATNLNGTFFTVQTLPPVLRDGASVILTSSLAAEKGFPAFSVYSATKAAIRSLARTLTTDLKGRRIRVNAPVPGISTRRSAKPPDYRRRRMMPISSGRPSTRRWEGTARWTTLRGPRSISRPTKARS